MPMAMKRNRQQTCDFMRNTLPAACSYCRSVSKVYFYNLIGDVVCFSLLSIEYHSSFLFLLNSTQIKTSNDDYVCLCFLTLSPYLLRALADGEAEGPHASGVTSEFQDTKDSHQLDHFEDLADFTDS